MKNVLLQGDCLERLKELPDESVDLIVTDPPYGYSFMGKDWDKAVPSVEVWRECLRVLKPGAFAFVMSAPRQDVLSQMIVRIGEAGFDTDFTSIYWTYASGFPKAMNIGKMVDKRLGLEREKGELLYRSGKPDTSVSMPEGEVYATEPVSDEAKALDGSYGGFQPKPAVEVIIVAMKPLSEKTYVDQALKNGKGITWLDKARIPYQSEDDMETRDNLERGDNIVDGKVFGGGSYSQPKAEGRFPANLLVSDDVLNDHSRFFSLDEWAQTLPFLAVPKASKSEKNRGLEDLPDKEFYVADGDHGNIGHLYIKKAGGADGDKQTRKNHHPTVKPLKLMFYLITLGSREGDLVLDPFAGSGTTCLAAKELKRAYIGIEREEEYVKIAEARLQTVQPTLI